MESASRLSARNLFPGIFRFVVDFTARICYNEFDNISIINPDEIIMTFPKKQQLISN